MYKNKLDKKSPSWTKKVPVGPKAASWNHNFPVGIQSTQLAQNSSNTTHSAGMQAAKDRLFELFAERDAAYLKMDELPDEQFNLAEKRTDRIRSEIEKLMNELIQGGLNRSNLLKEYMQKCEESQTETDRHRIGEANKQLDEKRPIVRDATGSACIRPIEPTLPRIYYDANTPNELQELLTAPNDPSSLAPPLLSTKVGKHSVTCHFKATAPYFAQIRISKGNRTHTCKRLKHNESTSFTGVPRWRKASLCLRLVSADLSQKSEWSNACEII